MGDFRTFSQAVTARFDELSKHELFVVNIDDIFAGYLASFPAGTDPIYRTRTEHDCSCCKQFVRNLGKLVAIIDGKIETVWNIAGLDEPYATVAASLDALVKGSPILSVYRTKFRQYGNATSNELLESGSVQTWNHFVGRVANKHFSTDADTVRGQFDAAAQVLRRGLEELTLGAIDTVVDLCDGALYRGAEHAPAVKEFRKLKEAFDASPNKDLFVFENIDNRAARFRNTVIGTLVTDIAAGMELEKAVRMFESKVAPTNYKRTTALITPRMVEQAVDKLKELGLDDAVNRRFAKITDVSVNNVLFVDNDARDKMKDSLTSLLMPATKSTKRVSAKMEAITIDKFLADVLPTATTVSVLVENKHVPNFVSLTAPQHDDTGQLFKWDNDFAWSYDGEVTDSIKARVKSAGGNVNALLRVSLAWFNKDDLDIHARTPNGSVIYYGNKGGILDVDMNAGSGTTRSPVENLAFRSIVQGTYEISVDQFSCREMADVGFTLEVEYQGVVSQFSHPRAVVGKVKALAITFVGGDMNIKTVSPNITGGNTPQEKWGITTESVVPVDTVMLSPNHWDGQSIGQRHVFFMLRGCKNPEPARGIYNEFLRGTLDPHRKVFEVLGSKTKCQPTSDQLSGVGFTANRGDEVTIVVDGRNHIVTF